MAGIITWINKSIKFVVLAAVAICIFCVGVSAASHPITIEVNGKPVEVSGQSPFLNEGRVMVPIRAVADAFGAKTAWNASEREAIIVFGGYNIILHAGEKRVLYNNREYLLDAAPQLINGRLFVPLRFISECFGYYVNWDHRIQTVHIRSEDTQYTDNPSKVTREDMEIKDTLQQLAIGETTNNVLAILGRPVRKELGFMGLTYWTYHRNYEEYYLLGFYGDKLHYIYTNTQHERVGEVAVGSSMQLAYQVANKTQSNSILWNNGSVKIVLKTPSLGDACIQVCVDEQVVLYHGYEGTVEGIEIFHPSLLIADDPIFHYTMIYQQALPTYGYKTSPAEQVAIAQEIDRQIFDISNVFRKKHGIAPLLWHDDAAKTALYHSVDMYARNYFSHHNPEGEGPWDRVTAMNITSTKTLENIARNTTNGPATMHAWMNSPSHRDSILNVQATHSGVGTVVGNDRYFTQLFLCIK